MKSKDEMIQEIYVRRSIDRIATTDALEQNFLFAVKAAEVFEKMTKAREEEAKRMKDSQTLPPGTKKFRVVSVSKNCYSFGLRGVVLLARDGEAWEIGVNYLHTEHFQEGRTVFGRVTGPGELDFGSGVEIPRRLAPATPAVLKEVFGKDA
jgi:hypothetical protein